jgi:membrane protease subunit HflK
MDLRIKAALISIVVNILLVTFKFFLARVSASASLHADAWHSISDLAVSVFVLGGLKVTTTSEKRNLVNWRGLEHIVALVVGGFIIYTGWRIFTDALRRPSEDLQNLGWVIIGALGCVVASYLIAAMKLRVGRLKNSPSLIADGYHSKMDMYSTVAVVIGLFGVMIGISLDRVAAGLVSIFIAITGLEIMTGSIKAIAAGTAITDYFLAFVFEVGRKEHRGGRLIGALAKGFAWLGSGRRYAYVIAVVLFGVWLLSGLYIVPPGEEGIVFIFGKIARSGMPAGMHYHIPAPVERVLRIPVDRIQRVELGFRTVGEAIGSARAYQWESRHQTGAYVKRLDESLIFTGDENIIDINTVIQYRIEKPVDYVLSAEDPRSLVSAFGQESLRRITSIMNIENLLTTDRTMIESMVAERLQMQLDEAASGVAVITVKLQDVHPPLEVVSAFREVASAREDMNRLINQAEAYRDSLIPEVRGQSNKLIAEANAQRSEAVEHSTGEAQRFLEVVEQYERAKDVTAFRMYLETMEKVLPGLDKYLIEPEAGGEPLDLRFFDEGITGTRGGW